MSSYTGASAANVLIRAFTLLTFATAAEASGSTDSGKAAAVVPAFFTVDGVTAGSKGFVMKLDTAASIATARDIIANKTSIHFMGKVVKGAMPWNVPWSFYLDPASIEFNGKFEPESCNFTADAVEANIVAGFAPNGGPPASASWLWCPWNSSLGRELPAADSTKHRSITRTQTAASKAPEAILILSSFFGITKPSNQHSNSASAIKSLLRERNRHGQQTKAPRIARCR